MKLQVTQENLSRALQTVSRIAASRASLPVLSNVLLQTDGSRLTVAATNLDIAISETIGAKVATQGSITVPAKLMQDFVSSLPNGTLELVVTDNRLQLSADRFDSTIHGMSAEEFPAMPIIEKGNTIEFQAGELKTLLQQVLFAASSDEARPVLTGVYVVGDEKNICFAATDSYRLAEKTLAGKKNNVSLLIPARSMSEIVRVLRDGVEVVKFEFDEQQARVTAGAVEIVTRLIDGKYPDYKKLLPAQFETTARMERSAITEITKVSSLFAREAAGSVTLMIDQAKQEVSISSIASQVGENTAVAPAVVVGDASVTLNSRYIIDALNAFEGSEIEIRVNGKLDPCVFVDPNDASYLHVIMPVKS